MPKKTIEFSRFERPMKAYLDTLVTSGSETVKEIATAAGVSQGHLNDQYRGKKPPTLDTIDLLARFRGKKATDALAALLGEAKKLDASEPGWDAKPQTPPKPRPVAGTPEPHVERREKLARAKQAQSKKAAK